MAPFAALPLPLATGACSRSLSRDCRDCLIPIPLLTDSSHACLPACLSTRALNLLPHLTQVPKMAANSNAQSRRAALGLLGAGLAGTMNPGASHANLFGKEPYKFEGSKLVYETISPPVYGSFYGTNMGNTAGNTYVSVHRTNQKNKEAVPPRS